MVARFDLSGKSTLALFFGIVMIMSIFMKEGTARVLLPADRNLLERWDMIVNVFANISFFGHGLSLTEFNPTTAHNVPVVILQQIGVIPALCWIWVTIYCLIKTPYKYAWTAIIGLSVFDHYLWTQAAVWWWALVGVSSVGHIPDYIFREARKVEDVGITRDNAAANVCAGLPTTEGPLPGDIPTDTGRTGEVKP
jgi:hypothetical protein